MSTVVIPPGYAQVSFEYRHTSYARPAYNVFGVNPPTPDPLQIARDMRDFFNATGSLVSRLDTQVNLSRVRAVVGQDGGPPTVGDIYPLTPGLRNQQSTSPALAVRVLWATGFGGRRGRGTQFRPWWISEGDVDEAGNISPTPALSVANAEEVFQNLLATNDYVPVLLHGTGVSAVPTPTPVISTGVDPVISNQVRRQTRR